MKNDRPSVQNVCVRAHVPAHKFILTNSFLVSVSFLQSATSPFFCFKYLVNAVLNKWNMYTQTHTQWRTHTLAHSHMVTHAHTHMVSHTDAHTHTHTHTHTLSHTHSHMVTHTHTLTWSRTHRAAHIPTFPTSSHSNSNQQLSQAAVSATPHKWRQMLSGWPNGPKKQDIHGYADDDDHCSYPLSPRSIWWQRTLPKVSEHFVTCTQPRHAFQR